MNSVSANLIGASIMVVDDQPANLMLLSEGLRTRGFRVRPVPNGDLALQAARHDPPDIILLDINMPGMNGYDVCEALKLDPATSEIPVIFVSAMGEISVKIWGFGIGAVDYVTKPFQFEELEARVCNHLEIARLRKELVRQNSLLESMVRQRTRELREARARLEVLDSAKADFLKVLSHEVRTPLSGVLGVAELMLYSSRRDSDTAEFAEMFEQSRTRLVTMIDDALLLTQLDVSAESMPDKPQVCLLEDALRHARSRTEPLAVYRGVELPHVPAGLGLIHGDPELMVRGLQSVLATAVSLAARGSAVRLSCTAAPGGTQLIIEADGLTIPESTLPRFFEPLGVAETISGAEDLGLAPAVAERVIRRMGGSIVAGRAPHGGIQLALLLRNINLETA
jgi:DNA-binding response OmpR family regulator